MAKSTAKAAVLLSIFMLIGMILAGIIMQPKASLEAWSIKESDFAFLNSIDSRSEFLLNYAILAPSSHNSQPWRFGINDSSRASIFG